jgi:spore coat protein U-like protein
MLRAGDGTGLAFGLALLLYAPLPQAGTYTLATVSVSTTVSANCTVATSALNFGAYDPIGAQATNNLDVGTNQISIGCVQGSAPTIAFNLGLNASGSTRRMLRTTIPADYLNYELYQPPGNSPNTACNFSGSLVVWGSAGSNLFTPSAPPSKANRSFNICARIPSGQDPSVGTYNDTVTATVNF